MKSKNLTLPSLCIPELLMSRKDVQKSMNASCFYRLCVWCLFALRLGRQDVDCIRRFLGIKLLSLYDFDVQVQDCVEIAAGSEEETEIRASSIVATDLLREALASRFAVKLHSVQLDWWLWEQGERQRRSHPPHHRTRTIFY